MKASIRVLLTAVAVSLSGSAAAITKPKSLAGLHCMNSRNQEIKAATKVADCKAPYHWVKAPAAVTKAKAKGKPNHVVFQARKHKGRVAALKKTTVQ